MPFDVLDLLDALVSLPAPAAPPPAMPSLDIFVVERRLERVEEALREKNAQLRMLAALNRSLIDILVAAEVMSEAQLAERMEALLAPPAPPHSDAQGPGGDPFRGGPPVAAPVPTSECMDCKGVFRIDQLDLTGDGQVCTPCLLKRPR